MCPMAVTVDSGEFEKFELKSVPADPNVSGDVPGFIMLRPLPYGMKLDRADKAMKMQMRTTPQDHKEKGGATENVFDVISAQRWSAEFDFAYCIGDHNLTDGNGKKVDFTNKMIFQSLNPRVGEEIATLIDKLNQDEDTELAEDFLKRQLTSSVEELQLSPTASTTQAEQHQSDVG